MRHSWHTSKDALTVRYSWKKNIWHHLQATAANTPVPIAPGSEEEFITEHYWGYTRVTAAKTNSYEVVHPQWKVYPVQEAEVQVDFGEVYGAPFSFLTQRPPDSVFLAEGSPVQVREGVPLAWRSKAF
ncbi:hypothetical protein FHS90_002961 [Rufibacter quisquiliarum]|uniref:DUF2071 domain-containing protein n=1 Tax=Rufibacter quisquiliarum TaxID=1549639 RepID=A0A839GRV1_9BACT|nr:hypothetical protein [Rufibacter quisquiliarum]